MLRSRIGAIGGMALAGTVLKILVASVLAAVAAWRVATFFESAVALESLPARLAVVIAGISAALLVYAGTLSLLRVEEFQRLMGRFRKG
jgi:peptidoglycan biosynthesis protein MviN/MurJ (putative lipid II flippase)